MPNKLIVLFLQYDTNKYPCSLHYFKQYLSFIKNADIKIIIIDNKIEEPFIQEVSENEIIINGDNTLWEFSGWQQGLEFIKQNNIDYDAILFANDSFLAPTGGRFDILSITNDMSLEECIQNNVMIGQLTKDIDGFIGKTYIENYIRTHCFMLSKPIIEIIKTIPTVGLEYLDLCVGKGAKFLKTSPIDKNITKEIEHQLSNSWHSKSNKQLYRMKILAYLNEMLLTAKVRGFPAKRKEIKETDKTIIKNIIEELTKQCNR